MSLRTEIFEQAETLQRLLSREMEVVERIAAALRSHTWRYVFLAARGTSDNAGRYANYLWGAYNRLPVALATPSLFTYYQRPPNLDGALLVTISQSGKSPDLLSVVAEGKRQGCPTLAITNAADSPLATAADFVIDIQAGPELAVAATKTYTAELMAIAMFSVALAQDDERRSWLQRVPEWVGAALELDSLIAQRAERYRYMSHCAVVGRGYNYATAFEWSLKLKELTYLVAEPYSSADFQHGPIAMVGPGFPLLAVAMEGAVFGDVLNLLQRVRNELQAEVVVISDRSEALELAQTPFRLPAGIPEWLTPLVAIVPGQLFAYHLTQARGFNPDQPRFITKVTETH